MLDVASHIQHVFLIFSYHFLLPKEEHDILYYAHGYRRICRLYDTEDYILCHMR